MGFRQPARVDWQCPRCLMHHEWNWPEGDDGPIEMVCDEGCEAITKGELVNTHGINFQFQAYSDGPEAA